MSSRIDRDIQFFFFSVFHNFPSSYFDKLNVYYTDILIHFFRYSLVINVNDLHYSCKSSKCSVFQLVFLVNTRYIIDISVDPFF